MADRDLADALCAQVRHAYLEGNGVAIRGGATKQFLVQEQSPAGSMLALIAHRGVVAYEPSELVITARAGTPLAEIEAVVAERGQLLPFEPPHFGAAATLGGVVASGLSGPRRPYAGAVRDAVLGVRMINGRGELLRFGGQVMKNVAGYDIARMLAGSFGTLGPIIEVSLKVVPEPALERTLRIELADPTVAIERMNQHACGPLPITAQAYGAIALYVRLGGAPAVLERARRALGGEWLEHDRAFWSDLNEHRLEFFRKPGALWRFSVPPATPPLALPGAWLLDWGGAQRWLKTTEPASGIYAAAAQAHGWAWLFRPEHGDHAPRRAPLPAPLAALHRRIKKAFDPKGIVNRDWLAVLGVSDAD